jgi:hypothetical protein
VFVATIMASSDGHFQETFLFLMDRVTTSFPSSLSFPVFSVQAVYEWKCVRSLDTIELQNYNILMIMVGSDYSV